MTSIDIDRDAAHDAAQNELAKPIYPRASPIDQIGDWINDLLYRITAAGSTVPGGWFTLSVLAILLVAAVVVAVRIARRTMRTARGTDPALFGAEELTAARHRSIAEQFAAQGDWSAAIRHRVRALARHLEETGVLNAVPGRTATELARDAAAEAGFPGFAPDACLVNRYEPGSRLSLHQDRNERDYGAPIVSVSLGMPAVFLFGGLARGDKTSRTTLFHGDVVVWGGVDRLRYHGVMPMQDLPHPRLGSLRINFTIRKAG